MLSIIASVLYYIGVVVFGIAMIALINRVFNRYIHEYEERERMYEEGVLVKR